MKYELLSCRRPNSKIMLFQTLWFLTKEPLKLWVFQRKHYFYVHLISLKLNGNFIKLLSNFCLILNSTSFYFYLLQSESESKRRRERRRVNVHFDFLNAVKSARMKYFSFYFYLFFFPKDQTNVTLKTTREIFFSFRLY